MISDSLGSRMNVGGREKSVGYQMINGFALSDMIIAWKLDDPLEFVDRFTTMEVKASQNVFQPVLFSIYIYICVYIYIYVYI